MGVSLLEAGGGRFSRVADDKYAPRGFRRAADLRRAAWPRLALW
jgi:hypothetical protein